MTVSNIINSYIEKSLQLPFIISNDLIQDESKDGACLRYDPAPAAELRYDDGSRLITYNLTYYVRCKNATAARDYSTKITNALDGARIEDIKTRRFIEVEALTLPQFISKDDKNYTTYAAAIECTFLEEKYHGGNK